MKIDLLLTICAHRVVSAPTADSIEKLRLCQNLGFNWSLALFTGDALISRSRSCACSKFLDETKVPYMLFIDDDIVFEPKDIHRIYQHLSNGYDIIGGIYAVRGATQLSSYGWDGKLDIDGQIHNVEYLATGFMGISRRVLEYMRAELPLPLLNPNDWSRNYPFFECGRCLDRDRGDPIYISEDWDFCHKARSLNYEIFADTAVQVGHIREQTFTPEDVRRIQSQAYMHRQIYGAMMHQQELTKSLDKDLAEFLNIPHEQVLKRLQSAQQTLAQSWNKYKGSAASFYLDNEDYLFDLAVFNASEHFWKERVAQLVNIQGHNVLDIGCGIGTLAFMMAEQGNKVVGWDINQKVIDLANFRKKKYNVSNVEFTTVKPNYKDFNLILAIDTLEHIEDLKGFLKVMGQETTTGTKFYHSDYFPKGNPGSPDELWPMHFSDNEKELDKWLQENGFIPWDAKWCVKA